MRTIGVIFLLALIAIAGEIYSDAVLTRGQGLLGASDAAAVAAAHGVKPG